MSGDSESLSFTDGVQDEILTDLARVAELKVISRTSVMQYRNKGDRNLREIGRQLGVAYIVEGSVQRVNNNVRVSAELIDARTDAHVWAQHYYRNLTDIFAIQSAIARNITDHLQAKLSRSEQEAINRRPTTDLVAYEFYIKAKEIVEDYLGQDNQRGALLKAVALLDEATQRDPGFVLAYCYAARADDLLYFLGFDVTPERAETAKSAIDDALRLRPDSSEAHFAKADYYFRCRRDYERASAELAIARAGLPNSGPLFTFAGYLDRRRGHWAESTTEFEKAVELDPRNLNAVNLLGDHYRQLRRFDQAERWWNKQAQLFPRNALVFHVYASVAHFAATGEIEQLRAALQVLPRDVNPSAAITSVRVLVALIQRHYSEATRILEESPLSEFQDVDYTFYYPKSWYEAQIARAAGEEARAHAAFAAAREVMEKRPQAHTEDPRTLAVLAQVDAGLGRKEQAIAEGRRAVEMMPISKDAYDGPLVLEGLAQVYVWTGEEEDALDALDQLIRVPDFIDYGYLLRDPIWTPLRSNSRFNEVLIALAPKKKA